MPNIFYTVLLSALVLLVISSEVIEKNNDTIISNQSLNKSSVNFITNVTENGKTNVLQSSSDLTKDSSINSTKNETLDVLNLNPVLPSMSDNSTDNHSVEPSAPIIGDDKSSIVNETNSSKEKDGTDDIPTFVEYQQMIEKETKQKREKTDSIPSSPTMILKDNHPSKGAIDTGSSHSTVEHSESSPHSSASIQETKDESESNHNVRKSDEVAAEMTTSTLSKSLMKNNVAAKECGAKILEISSQITNAGFVLNNNKDEYLNVPCSIPEKWFIFETCEPVQIKSIQIANFEMFSSRPKTFKVSTADRYPVKHWYNLGLFRAHDEKGIQTFEVSDTRMFKYLKFEMVDHYGNEHYCPLTFVRVMGNVVIDDIDEEPDEDPPVNAGDKNQSPKESSSTTDSNGLLTKAKDMLAKIVNGIGGSNKEVELAANQTDSEVHNNNDTRDDELPSVQSPCYFIEFVSKNYRNYFQDIWHHFAQIDRLKSHITESGNRNLEVTILRQPFPLQIRADYSLLSDWINKTEYNFWRLYLSFVNTSSQFPRDYFVQNSLENVSVVFRCHFDHYPSLGHYDPVMPIITSHSSISQINIGNITSSVVTPTVTILKTEDNTNYSETSPPGQYEPALSGNVEVTSTSNHPINVNGSVLEEVLVASRTKIEDDQVVGVQENRTNVGPKDTKPTDTSDNSATDTHKMSASVKYKSDDVFDNKMFANPGSNAWNYAFMRIKNIAKELEVNVSISMKYLEELSQNYKQQTERLKKAQSVTGSNVTRLENLIHRHRQETKTMIKELKVQLQAIIIRMKIGVSPAISTKRTSGSMNLSTMDKDPDSECIDMITEGLTIPGPSWFESSMFLITLNVSLSLLCNSILLAVVYNKMKTNILHDVANIITSSSTYNNQARVTIREPIEELSSVHRQRASISDLRHPVVLPPRGVHLSTFPDSDYLSDNDNLPRQHKGLGSFFYPVQPNVHFVTPTKDKKKKKRK